MLSLDYSIAGQTFLRCDKCKAGYKMSPTILCSPFKLRAEQHRIESGHKCQPAVIPQQAKTLDQRWKEIWAGIAIPATS